MKIKSKRQKEGQTGVKRKRIKARKKKENRGNHLGKRVITSGDREMVLGITQRLINEMESGNNVAWDRLRNKTRTKLVKETSNLFPQREIQSYSSILSRAFFLLTESSIEIVQPLSLLGSLAPCCLHPYEMSLTCAFLWNVQGTSGDQWSYFERSTTCIPRHSYSLREKRVNRIW